MGITTMEHCGKLTKRGQVCGRTLLANGTCPSGQLHEAAPWLPPRWPSIATIVVGVLLTSAFLAGAFSFLGPFSSNGAPSVGPHLLSAGASETLTEGETYGLYALYSCSGADNPSQLLASFTDGATTVDVRASRNGPSYAQTPFFSPSHSVKECGSFTATRTGIYAVTFASRSAGTFGLVPNSALGGYRLYQAMFFLGPLVVVVGMVLFVLTRRRRDNVGDPTEQPDVSFDPIARAAKVAGDASTGTRRVT
jgi:hypothetical protein